MNDSQVQAIRKAYRLRSRLLSAAMYLFLIAAVAVGLFWHVLAGLLLIIAIFAVFRRLRARLQKDYIFSILHDRMDAPLYAAVIQEINPDHTNGLWQWDCEYFNGRYENAVSLCRQLLADKRLLKKYKYEYLTRLAIVYFDVGNDEKLREICDIFDTYLATDEKAEKIRQKFARMQFFPLYLNRDVAALDALPKTEPPNQIMRTFRAYNNARVALLKGDTETARSLFTQIAAAAPNINYGMLAQRALEAMDGGKEYREAFADPEPTEICPVWRPSMAQRVYKVFWRIYLIAYAACLLFGVLTSIDRWTDEKFDALLYAQTLSLLVEEEYGEVEILDIFYPEKDGEILDEIFLARADDGLIFASVYHYEGEDQNYAQVHTYIPLESFEDERFDGTFTFPCVTSDYYLSGQFGREGEALPTDIYYISVFTIDDESFCFVITYIEKEPPSQ